MKLETVVRWTAVLGLPLALGLAACSGPGKRTTSAGDAVSSPTQPGSPAGRSARRGGGYYLDDGPGETIPVDIASVPDAVPRAEPLLERTMRPYVIFGREYRPMTALAPYRQRGVATWYGRRYHGNRTSSGEVYDMYAMTAAHPTLPIPSYVRVTHLRNGRSVTVRVNDRGPFLHDRLIDLSYTAAAKLGYVGAGSAEVEVELLTDFSPGSGLLARDAQPLGAVQSAVEVNGGSSATNDAGTPRLTMTAEPAPSRSAPATAAIGEAPPLALSFAPEPAGSGAMASPAPALAPAPAPAPALAPAASTTGRPFQVLERSYWLQFGAFGSEANAEAALARLRAELGTLGAPLDVYPDAGMFKIQAGPWPTRDAAGTVASRVLADTGFQPFTLMR